MSGFKGYSHRRSLTHLALDGDSAAPAIDDLPADGETEPAAARSRREVGLEDAGQHVGGDALTIIPNDDRNAGLAAVLVVMDTRAVL